VFYLTGLPVNAAEQKCARQVKIEESAARFGQVRASMTRRAMILTQRIINASTIISNTTQPLGKGLLK